MNVTKLFPLLLLFIIINYPAFGQSAKKMNKYLTQKWVSAASINDGDTVAMDRTDEILDLKKGNILNMAGQGSEMTGVWSYDAEANTLVMEVKMMDGKDVTEMNMKVGLDILQAENKILTVSKQGRRTVIYVIEGSGVGFD